MAGLSSDQLAWLYSAAPLANQQAARTGLDANYILAQSALESGYGQSGLSSNYNNYFGIKGSGANSVSLPTTECDASGNCYKTTGNFATYPSMADSFKAYGDYILKKGTSGYATDTNYSSKIASTMNKIKSIIGDSLTKGLTSIPGIGTAKSVTDGLGVTGNCNWVCQIRNWLKDSNFWQRVAMVIIGFIFIVAALRMFGNKGS